jgi:hypothetical protein
VVQSSDNIDVRMTSRTINQTQPILNLGILTLPLLLLNMVENGLKGGLRASQAVVMLIAAFIAIAWYNVIELNIMIWMRFKRHRGLYFWSLCVSSWGIAVNALAFLAKNFEIWRNDTISIAVAVLGWYCMITGQSLVLYSRLHLVMQDKRKVKWVLYMIIVNFFLFQVTTTVFVFGVISSMVPAGTVC